MQNQERQGEASCGKKEGFRSTLTGGHYKRRTDYEYSFILRGRVSGGNPKHIFEIDMKSVISSRVQNAIAHHNL